MTVTMSLTEFNRSVSKATRLAKKEDVVITDRGVDTFVLKYIKEAPHTFEALVAAGKATRARARGIPEVLPPALNTDIDLGAILDGERNSLIDEYLGTR